MADALRLFWVLAIASSVAYFGEAVDKAKFRTCKSLSFCRRYRKYAKQILKEHKVVHELDTKTFEHEGHVARARIRYLNSAVNETTGEQIVPPLSLEVALFRSSGAESATCDLVRVTIAEGPQALRLRFRPRDGDVVSVTNDVVPDSASVTHAEHSIRMEGSTPGSCLVELYHRPLEIALSSGGRVLQRLNARNLLNFEQHREPAKVGIQHPGLVDATDVEAKDAWQEKFGGYVDTKPYGPAAVGMDITFASAPLLSGLAEHASRVHLADPDFSEPYRLFNLDVFEYEVDTPMALYGAVPMVTAVHRPALEAGNASATEESSASASGLLVVNPSDGFVKVQGPDAKSTARDTETWWLFESGVLDIFAFLGPSPEAVLRQYHAVTGWPRLPLQAALGKHQSRWNYVDVEDVISVDNKFDEHHIPYDFIWLDLEHTRQKRYFTWDPVHFADAGGMLDHMFRKGRKLVTIVDPHLKGDANYTPYLRMKEAGLFTRSVNGTDFEGFCWPGPSFYPDFCNPATREEWAKLFDPAIYPESRPYLYTWNDMNEPSVFDGPEVTMPRDNLHKCHGEDYSTEHRDMHNLYGFYQHEASVDGQLFRAPDVRPFVLTRAFFAGTHRHGPVWTGDNSAAWSHLRRSVSMLVSLALCGISFAGADIPGFFGDPDDELYVRWHQLGIWYPFYRAHAHLTTKRREPWLRGPEVTMRVREAVLTRYELLPMWYTLFYEWASQGLPVVRPLWYHSLIRSEGDAHADEQMLVGEAILVRAIVKPKATTVPMYFPPGKWFDYYDLKAVPLEGGSVVKSFPVHPAHVPVFVKSGNIIAQKRRPRRSVPAMSGDPFTIVAYGPSARGRLYVDDGQSHDYKAGAFVYVEFDFDGSSLRASSPSGAKDDGDAVVNFRRLLAQQPSTAPRIPRQGFRIERTVFVGLEKPPRGARLIHDAISNTSAKELQVNVEPGASGELWLATVKEPGVYLDHPFDWVLQLQY